tara:strand:+ start:750 stop:869 length:120 start_codon:yes stop_codon:yes gene_type:complete
MDYEEQKRQNQQFWGLVISFAIIGGAIAYAFDYLTWNLL